MKNKIIHSELDIYKFNIRKKYYLSLCGFKLPVLLKRHKKDFVEYRLFFVLPFLRIKDKGDAHQSYFTHTHNHYQTIIQRINDNKPIRVGFLIIYDSVWSYQNIYARMLKDSTFELSIIIIPDTSRGEENMYRQMAKTTQTFSSYANVLQSYDTDKKAFIDFSDKLDIAFFASPYDSMTHSFYTIAYLSKKLLTIYLPYGYTGYLNYSLSYFSALEFSLLWKIYVENPDTCALIKQHQKAKDIDNLCIVGYPKMDSLYTTLQNLTQEQRRKKIIIAPHHTVFKESPLHISNFLRLSEFFLRLPLLYPQIDFIFRPHPLLFITMKNKGGGEFVENYLSAITQIPNMVYQEGGEYFESFATSDALIHDCGSFLAEYLYTDKPQAFIIQDQETITTEFTEFGKEILDHLYLVSTQEDIIHFIDSVVLNEQDSMKESRLSFAHSKITINYPNATQHCLDDIKISLGINQ